MSIYISDTKFKKIKMPAVVDDSGRGLNIIFPPPEVRNIVDKTASFVARNGPEFEQRIKQNEINNPKFNFLNNGDPYHAYYQHRVIELREGKDEKGKEEKESKEKSPTTGQSGTSDVVKQRQTDLLKSALKEQKEPALPKDPPSEFEFIADPPSISAFDLGKYALNTSIFRLGASKNVRVKLEISLCVVLTN